MKVLKFGGTSVGSVAGIVNVKNILKAKTGRKVLVLSAMAGVTNKLVELTKMIEAKNNTKIAEIIAELKYKHETTIDALIEDEALNVITKESVQNILSELSETSKHNYSETLYAQVVTTGERLLTTIFSGFLTSCEMENNLLDAKDFMHVANLENPDTDLVGTKFTESTAGLKPTDIYITRAL